MFTRTTATKADPSCLEAGINHVREVIMPALARYDGYVGLSMLADRSTGQCIVTSAWESEEAMRATTDAVQELRDHAIEILRGEQPQLDHWEIAVLHREHEIAAGACARVTWVRVDPAQIDAGIEMFKSSALPALEEIDGMCSVSIMVNRESGRAVSSVVYDSADAFERNREQIERIKSETTRNAGADVIDEHDFEVCIAQLRVPELV